jgi:adenosine deaminase
MPTLLVSLGTSPAIVPEAFLLPGVEFSAVHVLTTESTPVEFVTDWFHQHAPDITLTVSRVLGFTDFRSEEDHFRFEEVLYRWWLEKAGPAGHPHVCLSGGFKTMSAAMQKAATVLSAAEVFHVLCDLSKQPGTAEEIEAAREGGNLHWIRLGSESGWPQFAHPDAGRDFPLTVESITGCVSGVRAGDDSFRRCLNEVVERSQNIAGAWNRISDLPFPALATLPAAVLDWLDEALDPVNDHAWLLDLPKVDLHCHLGGFATEGSLLHDVRQAANAPGKLENRSEPEQLDGWPLPGAPIGLEAYRRRGDASGSALLKDSGCLKRHIELLYAHFQEQNLIYAEVRCSPANYSGHGRSSWDILSEIRWHFERCRSEADAAGRPAPLVNLIVIATRQPGGDFRTGISRHLALAATAFEHWTDDSKPRVVGVDLAGFENRDTRAHYFRDDFTAALRLGMGITIHAGENDDAEGIWSAILDLNARRLGHALHLDASPTLLRTVADRRIGIEMCPYANQQILGFPLDGAVPSPSASNYPLLTYLSAGVAVTVNTDNIGISAASLTENFLLLPRLCPGIRRVDVLQLLRNAVDQAFLTSTQKNQLLAQITIPHR